MRCRYCGHTLTDPGYYQEKLFEPSKNAPIMKNQLSKKYAATDLLPRLGETVVVWHTNRESDTTEAVLVAIVKDGVMLCCAEGIDRNDEWSPLSFDEFNEKCRFKDHE